MRAQYIVMQAQHAIMLRICTHSMQMCTCSMPTCIHIMPTCDVHAQQSSMHRPKIKVAHKLIFRPASHTFGEDLEVGENPSPLGNKCKGQMGNKSQPATGPRVHWIRYQGCKHSLAVHKGRGQKQIGKSYAYSCFLLKFTWSVLL